MCIAAWLWQSHPVYPLLLLLNRDEFHDRYDQNLSLSLLQSLYYRSMNSYDLSSGSMWTWSLVTASNLIHFQLLHIGFTSFKSPYVALPVGIYKIVDGD